MGVKSQTFHQSARRDQLVDLATEIIGEDGVAGLTISALARRAGVSRGVIGYNVGDLDALLALVVARAYSLGREQVRPAVDAAGDPLGSVHGFVSASLRFYREHPAEMRALKEVFTDPHLIDRATTPEHRREAEELGDLVSAGQRAGSIARGDVTLLTSLVRAALDVAANRIAAGDDDAAMRDELTAVVDRLLRP
ncbi:hypothetical protein GCM10011519_33280 [Marmoricola endophyticus]|uniref:HTH tetR-type domain-containing protein n=1 Tax=Marmoricola endophyticus TaxID=2040280 RepID=A0A917BTZ1_9ACTN|nr:TetR/AcrR family transcriptional regulator [Marmoricola endophyticus]GGF56714.1 hypothetical protein GCM10011519_33280 [Marmoricola endophyticus]